MLRKNRKIAMFTVAGLGPMTPIQATMFPTCRPGPMP